MTRMKNDQNDPPSSRSRDSYSCSRTKALQGGTRCPQRVDRSHEAPAARYMLAPAATLFVIGPSRTGIFRRSRSHLCVYHRLQEKPIHHKATNSRVASRVPDYFLTLLTF